MSVVVPNVELAEVHRHARAEALNDAARECELVAQDLCELNRGKRPSLALALEATAALDCAARIRALVGK